MLAPERFRLSARRRGIWETMMRTSVRWMLAAGAATMLAFPPTVAGAQEMASRPAAAQELTGFWLTTPYPELSIRPGETESIQLTLRNGNLPPQRASLEVSGVPEGWEWALKGGGREVTAAIVGPDSTERLTLELTPPAGAGEAQSHAIEVRAVTGGETAALPLVVRLSEAAEAGGLTLEPELPGLRGTARSTFTYRVKVKNDGAEDGLFNLAAQAPQGFTTRFKRGYGSEEITGLPVNAGATENVTLEVVPARNVPAGRYPVAMEVSGGGHTATTELSLDVTGTPEVRLIGPQERLSGEATAGRESTFTFTLANAGSAPATDLEMGATPPQGWTVRFDPQRIDAIQPNGTVEVNVSITPSERAIAGDYMVTVRADGESASEQAQFRVAVRTSTLWGAAGLGVIAAAALVLGLGIMRYGRR